jgi:hypothetical protein
MPDPFDQIVEDVDDVLLLRDRFVVLVDVKRSLVEVGEVLEDKLLYLLVVVGDQGADSYLYLTQAAFEVLELFFGFSLSI